MFVIVGRTPGHAILRMIGDIYSVFKSKEEAEARLLECKRTYPTRQYFLLGVIAEAVPVDPKYEVKYKN